MTNAVVPIYSRSSERLGLLVVEDDEATRQLCTAVGAEARMRTMAVRSAEEALEHLETDFVDIVLTDLSLPSMGGLELLSRIKKLYPHICVVVAARYGVLDTAVAATRMGASAYLSKPFRIEELRSSLSRAAETVGRNSKCRPYPEGSLVRPAVRKLIGTSEKMQSVLRMIEKVGRRDCSVLILGESGTGKELVARAIHDTSCRRNAPFVPVDCSALTPTLVASELFGFVKGAFTGATQSRVGLLEAANGGTLFLDEIGDMPVELQTRLLRALQEREIRPVGATETRPFDVRIIAATNRDLDAGMRAGSFREDLYFRINVVRITLPPLRERKTDIPELVDSILEKHANAESPKFRVSPDAMQQLLAHDWPGNVRELENAIGRALAFTSGSDIRTANLPSSLQSTFVTKLPPLNEILPLKELERRAILSALREASYDKTKASKILGIGKTTLYRKLREYKFLQSES